jgi:type II secretion system-associated lipoprotein
MKRKYLSGILCAIVVGFVTCATLVTDEDRDRLKVYEEQTYIMLKNIIMDNQTVLRKGQEVKLYLIPTDEWIKVYAYSSRETFLQSKRILVLYLFESDFKDGIFSLEEFTTYLRKVVKPKK